MHVIVTLMQHEIPTVSHVALEKDDDLVLDIFICPSANFLVFFVLSLMLLLSYLKSISKVAPEHIFTVSGLLLV